MLPKILTCVPAHIHVQTCTLKYCLRMVVEYEEPEIHRQYVSVKTVWLFLKEIYGPISRQLYSWAHIKHNSKHILRVHKLVH